MRRGQRGIALVAVLWALVLLAVIAATVLSESRTQSRLARNFLDAAKALDQEMVGAASEARISHLSEQGDLISKAIDEGLIVA